MGSQEEPTQARLSVKVCEGARLSRDPRFDGLFYTAVKSTGIYCRPICPARPPKPSNVLYYFSAAQCEAHGFRPCMRCRPEQSPAQDRDQKALTRAFRRVQDGYLQHKSLESLAASLDMSPRHLSRCFVQHFGATPTQVHATQRLLFARRLLKESAMSITHIAYASGFSSQRRFNDAFVKAYALSPSRFRNSARPMPGPEEPTTLKLHYRPPLAFEHTLQWLGSRLIQGVEAIEEGSYLRLLSGKQDGPQAWFCVRRCPKTEHALQLRAYAVPPQELRALVLGVRRMFDLDAHPELIAQSLGQDPKLGPLIQKNPGIRIPGAWDGFETVLRAIIGQQVSVAAAHTITQRVMQRLAVPLDQPPHPALTQRFDGLSAIKSAELSGLGLTGRRIESIHAVAQALEEGRVSFELGSGIEDWLAAWTALPGIGPWTASYLALRVLGYPDLFPAGDLVLRKAMTHAEDEKTPTPAKVRDRALPWSPWRSYAAFHLWHSQSGIA